MNTLFDRYFLVLAGRLTKDHWGTVATPVHVGSGVITLGWPSEAPTQSREPRQDVNLIPYANRSSS